MESTNLAVFDFGEVPLETFLAVVKRRGSRAVFKQDSRDGLRDGPGAFAGKAAAEIKQLVVQIPGVMISCVKCCSFRDGRYGNPFIFAARGKHASMNPQNRSVGDGGITIRRGDGIAYSLHVVPSGIAQPEFEMGKAAP